MKKFLSLVLALVMTMSLVTVSAGAKDFDDNADITYVEAVDVMSDLKIVDGDLAGNFNPQNGLTRGAAAKIICNLILGPTTAAELNADTNPFPDVDKDSTYAGYIAYCAKEGIVGGYADGTFKQANPLTGYAFMKMLLGALGYDADVEGYNEPNWSISVAKQAIGIGLNDNLVDEFNGSDYVTREEAMLYAFNTMKATMVDYDTTITIGDVTVAGSNEYEVANNARVETIYEDGKMQFAEKYFTKLVLDDTTSDAFERPTNTWINGKEEIGSYVDYTEIAAEYTTTITGKDLYDVVGKTAYADYDFYAYVDGVEDTDLCDKISKNNKGDVDETGNGALTQVFVNNDEETVIVTVINTYLAKATMDYNAKKDSVSFEVYDIDSSASVSGEEFDIADVKADDFVLVTYDESEDEIVTIEEVEIIADTEIQKFSSTKAGSLTVDGTKYNYNQMAKYDADVLKVYTGETINVTNLKDITYNIYLDTYGYVVGVEEVEAPDNFLFVTGADAASSNLVTKTWEANAIFMDGTVDVIDVKSDSITTAAPVINAWYSYTVNNDGVYTLTLVDSVAIVDGDDTKGNEVSQYRTTQAEAGVIDAKHIALQGAGTDKRVYGNDATIYMLADLDKVYTADTKVDNVIITGVDEVVTGVKNAAFEVWNWEQACKDADVKYVANERTNNNTSSGVYALYKDNGYVIAAVVVGESDTITSSTAYVITDGASSESYDKTTKTWTWTRDVIIDGEKVELTETNDTGVSALEAAVQYSWVTVKYYADGTVKELEKITDADVHFTNFTDVVKAVEAEDEDVVILNTEDNKGNFSLKGSSLYDAVSDKLGFLVAEDVKVVLTQTVKNKTTTSYDEGIKVLEATLKDLNEVSKKYDFDALIEDGIATVVIIKDEGSDGADLTGPSGSTTVGETYAVASVDKVTRTIYLDKEDWTADPNKDAKVLNAAMVALNEMGWEMVSTTIDKTTSPWSVKAVNIDSGNPYELSWFVDVEK